MKRTAFFSSLLLLPLVGTFAACGDSSTEATTPDSGVTLTGFDSSSSTFDAASSNEDSSTTDDSGSMIDSGVNPTDANADAGKILAAGLVNPVGYTSFADSPFNGVNFNGFFYLENWEDGVLNTPGVTTTGTIGTGGNVDSVDGDDGLVDGKCEKEAGTCTSGFALNGTIAFTFDSAGLGGQLPTHVGVVWTDGAPSCDAIFEAYDANDGLVDASVALIGTKTVTAIGDGNNLGGVAEDRFFGVVHAGGIKRIVVKSSAGGVEVDHLQYGR